jgi:transposase InsO family protein
VADRVPQINHSDHGVQYDYGDYTDLLREHGTQINMGAVSQPEDNDYTGEVIVDH